MAELRVEPGRGRNLAWVWIMLLALLVAAVAYWLWSTGRLTSERARTDTVRDSLTAPLAPPGD